MFALNTVSSHHPQTDVSCTDTTLDLYEIEEHNFNLVLHNYFLVQKYLKNQSKWSLNFQRTKYSGSKIACLCLHTIAPLLYPCNQPTFLKFKLLDSMKKLSKGQSPRARRNTILQANCLEEHRGKWWFSLKDPQQERP